MEQISPVPGTYQARLAPAGDDTSVDVHPVRSVLARAKEARKAGRRTTESECILTVLVCFVKCSDVRWVV